MKKTLLYITFIGLFTACSKDSYKDVVETAMQPPGLSLPENNFSVVLDRVSNPVLTLTWSRAQTADHTIAYYRLQIDSENGDFTDPVFSSATDSSGIVKRFDLTHQELNVIAASAGIAAGQKGKLKWRVLASNGVISAESAETRMIEVERPEGTVEIPSELYLTGSATENGTDIGAASQFKQTAGGVFEIYTSLSAGTFHFAGGKTADAHTFIFKDGLISDGSDAASPATTKKVYRIVLDFNTNNYEMTEIRSVGLWFAYHNSVTMELAYDKDGTFQLLDTPITFANASWGKDERYKFRVVEVDAGGTETVKFLGSMNKNNDKPNNNTPAAWYFLLPVDNSQWDYTYKFRQETASGSIFVKFTNGGQYTHEVKYN